MLSGINSKWLRKFQIFSEEFQGSENIFNLIIDVKEASPFLMAMEMQRLSTISLDLTSSYRKVPSGSADLECIYINIQLPKSKLDPTLHERKM